jgi:hypothetical protein
MNPIMKIHELLFIFFLICFPSWALAAWQIVKPAAPTTVATAATAPVLKDQDPFTQTSKTTPPARMQTQTTEIKTTEVKTTAETYPAKQAYEKRETREIAQTSEQIYRPMPIAEKPAPSVPYRHMKTYRAYLDKDIDKNTYRYPSRYTAIKAQPQFYAISISGSVKENFERIMRRYNWKVIWKAPYDYNYDGKITGSSLPDVIEKLFQPFPLQAVMYMSNRTIAVVAK